MTAINYAHIALCVDRSGSMVSTKDDAEGGIRTFLTEQFATSGKTTASIYQFDDTSETVCSFVSECPRYVLSPRGSTALLDAIGFAATDTGNKLAALTEALRPDKVYLVVVTDGHENASREWTKSRVADLLKTQQEQYAWEVIFLAADITAIQTAASYGIGISSSIQYSGVNTGGTYSTLSASVLRSRSAGESVSFTEAERAAAVS